MEEKNEVPEPLSHLLSQLIKDLSIQHDYGNPFHDDFDFDKLKNAISEFEETNKIEYNQNGFETIESILILNRIYEFLMLEIENEIVESGFSVDQLIEGVFLYANANFLNIYRLADEELNKQISSATIDDMTVPPSLLIDNVEGEKSGVQGAIDNTVDVVIELLDIIPAFAINNNRDLDNDRLLKYIHNIFILTSQLVTIRGAFYEFQFEFMKIVRTKKNTLCFLNNHKYFKTLKEAGGIRLTKLAQEFLLQTNQYRKDSMHEVLGTYVKNGYLKISSETRRVKSTKPQVGMAQFEVYFAHLDQVKLKGLKNYSVNDLFRFINSIKNLFSNYHDESVNPIEIKDIYHNIPFRILRQDLLNYVKKTTGLAKPLVEKLITDLTTNNIKKSNLWKKPFFAHNGDLFYVLPAIEGGHLEYLLNNLLKYYLSKRLQLSKFTKNFDLTLEYINHKYKFKKFPTKETKKLLGKSEEGVIIYTLKSKIILFKSCHVDFPIESREYHNVIYEFWQTSQDMKRVSEIIKQSNFEEFENKEIINIGVINFPSLSGFTMEGTYFLDPILISNYFSVGELQRVRINFKDGLNKKEISSFRYYENEDEFNENFKYFCLSPEPIVEIISRLHFKSFKLTFGNAPFTIYQEGISVNDLQQSIDNQINEISYYFDQLHYFEKNIEKGDSSSYLRRKLHYLIPVTLNFISIGTKDRQDRKFLLTTFKKARSRGLGYLIYTIQKGLVSIKKLKVNSDPQPPQISAEIDAKKLADDCIKETLKKHGAIFGMSTVAFGSDLSEQELEAVLAYLYGELGVFRPRYYTEEELELFLVHISIMAGFIGGNKKYSKLLQGAFINFIDILNFNYQYQKARDICEEILEFCFKKVLSPSLGWLCLFKCYLKQNSLNESAYYLSLYLSSISSESKVSEYQLHAALYNAFLFFRDAGIDELAESIYKILSTLGENDAEEQKITLSYYNLKLRKLFEDDSSIVGDVIEYLKDRWDSIIKFGPSGVLPWVALLFNIKNIHKAQEISIPTQLDDYLSKLKNNLDKDTLDELESRYFRVEQSKKSLDRALTGVFESRYFEDFAAELSNLRLLSKNTLALSVNPLDINYLLKSGIALNDNFLTFNERKDYPLQVPFTTGNHENISKYLETYADKLLSKINLKSNQVLFWLFTLDDNIFIFQLKPDKSFLVKLIEDWDLSKFHKWRSDIPDFVFTDIPDYSINLQEQAYANKLSLLNFTHFDVGDDYNDVLIYFTIELSMLPHNLIQINITDESISEKHEYLVKNKIRNLKRDFIGLYKAVTNIFSLEWFAEKGQDFVIPKSKFKISGWAPLEDKDYALLGGASKLEPIIKKVGGVFHRELIPNEPLNSDLNFFLAHGDKGIEGFKTVYSREDDAAHAIMKGEGVRRIFGSGKIAVLFICNSASISPEIYSQTLISFINEIMSLGYNTVIAPAWKLNSDIPAAWMKPFLENFLEGEKVSISVQKANNAIAFSSYNEYHGFYDPSGWAVMHIYGNPNVSIDPTQ